MFPRLHRLVVCVLVLCMTRNVFSRSSQISDLKSKISGVEELLEEFRKQLQQDQAYSRDDETGDVCLNDFNAVEEHIIRARDSIEHGATFLSAPNRVYSWEDCLHACCADPHCTVAVMQEDLKQSSESLSCYLFNCTYRNKNVCSFSYQQGFSIYSRVHNSTRVLSLAVTSPGISKHGNSIKKVLDETPADDSLMQDTDEPPRSDAGQDVVVQLPTDWAVLDGRDSIDDHGVTRYEWALVKGDPTVTMKVTHPGLLKISDLQEGVYTFQMTVTDTAGQKSSDNVSVTVLAPEHQAEVCTGHCTRYQFLCDDGCCIDISYACDGKQQCPDRSDEAFCQNFDGGRKTITHSDGPPTPPQTPAQPDPSEDRAKVLKAPKNSQQLDRGHSSLPSPPQPPKQPDSGVSQEPCSMPPVVGPCKGVFPRWYYDPAAGECKHFLYGGCKGNHNNFLQELDCVKECIQRPGLRSPISEVKPQNDLRLSKLGHPPPESGAILPLALGLIISALLLLMVGCRLRLVRRRLKKARPLTTEESDYLINGMYL
ncbi:low-density lipoprotein receptor-related protein 11 [Chanos chanos]|uniref:Low-density lipoprotein receptor-related protein 11 n=1 Tax=Chanos chanos TaxID=29144 RepID=A0A6J2W3M3_CHACN|nr:low-density lipoprotein receptor-related protein 11 [Chanos chanos]